MKRRILMLTLALTMLSGLGCAADFRAGSPNRGVDLGASIGQQPVYVQPVP